MIAILHALLESNERQPERFASALAELLKSWQPPQPVVIEKAASSPVGSLGNDFPGKISQLVALPSKMELAVQWLKANPEDSQLTGRDLEALRMPHDVKISYRTWNDAKKEVQGS